MIRKRWVNMALALALGIGLTSLLMAQPALACYGVWFLRKLKHVGYL